MHAGFRCFAWVVSVSSAWAFRKAVGLGPSVKAMRPCSWDNVVEGRGSRVVARAAESASSRTGEANRAQREEWRRRKIAWSSPPLTAHVEPDHVSAASDLRTLDRRIVIVTTASLPWMTGTAVNPALRAAYLSARGYRNVTLLLPWLPNAEEQAKLFGPNLLFSSPYEQAEYVRRWCAEHAADAMSRAPRPFAIGWYPARYAGGIGSILCVDDIMSHIDKSENDVCVLEEPEHINWYRNGPRWTSRFRHVVGIAHTNYEAYAATEPSRDGRAALDALAERVFTETVTRAHCDVVIQLSATLRPLPHSRVCNVHGVRESFLRAGDTATPAGNGRCYFLGKALWAKGYDQLLLLTSGEDAVRLAEIDCFGAGQDLDDIESKARALGSRLNFMGRADHGNLNVFSAYDVFVNPSISEVLCTATAEALAMGKSVVISRHPSNEFFYAFEKCHVFAPGDRAEFGRALEAARAQQRSNSASDRAQRRAMLEWDAATDRLILASALDVRAPPARLALASLVMHSYHWGMTASPLALDLWLTISGAGPHTPWATRYPAAFKALNRTEAALSHAGRALEKASARLKRGDELAARFSRRTQRRVTRGIAPRPADNDTAKLLSPLKATVSDDDNDLVRRRYYRRWPRLLASLGLRKPNPPKSWLLAHRSLTADQSLRLKLPKQLAERTARAASLLRKDLLERDIALRDDRRRLGLRSESTKDGNVTR